MSAVPGVERGWDGEYQGNTVIQWGHQEALLSQCQFETHSGSGGQGGCHEAGKEWGDRRKQGHRGEGWGASDLEGPLKPESDSGP